MPRLNHLVACAAIVLLALLGLASAASAEAKTLRMAYDSDPTSLDPHEQLSSATLQLSHLLFDPLVRFDKNLKLQPRLAKSWEQVDNRTTRFHLRESVKFHSGRTLGAQDVVWTFNRLKQSPDFKALFEPFEGARAIDDLTVDLITKAPYPLVLNLASYIFPLDRQFYTDKDGRGRPKEEIVKHGASFASNHSSGTGPFVITAREQGVRTEFKRFAGYWDKDSPGNVDRILFTPIKEPATRIAALLAGDVDFISPVPPTDVARVRADPCCSLVTMPSTRIMTFELNQQRVPAFKDPRVRLAINYAINREGIAEKILRGFATPAGQLSPETYAGYDPALVPRFDVGKGKALMEEAGYGGGFSVTMLAPNNRYIEDARIAEAVAAMLAKIGIKVDLQTMPKAQYWQRFDERAGDIMMIGWQSDTQDSANFYEFLVMTTVPRTGYGQYNAGNYSNAEVDALTVQTQTMTDPVARGAVLKKIERILYDDAALVPLHWPHLTWAATRNVRIEPVLNVLDMPYLGDLAID